MKLGDRVKIVDGSEAHGDIGVIWSLPSLENESSGNGIIVVELQGSTLWPVSKHEIVYDDEGI
jgi:hypothetical protein